MKKKFLISILIILLSILIILIVQKTKKTATNSISNETSRDFMLKDPAPSTINTHGENAGIYLGVKENDTDNFLFISIKIDKSASKEEQVKSLISSISTTTGYKIDVNSITINGSTIKIDLAKTAAPFELTESYEYTDKQKYYMATDYTIEKTLLDSINKTLKSYFGEDTKVYLSADSADIHIDNGVIIINIDANKEYDEQ